MAALTSNNRVAVFEYFFLSINPVDEGMNNGGHDEIEKPELFNLIVATQTSNFLYHALDTSSLKVMSLC